MKQEFGADLDVQLLAGSGGIFEVRVEQKCIFSKKQAGRFPEDGEISGLVTGNK